MYKNINQTGALHIPLVVLLVVVIAVSVIGVKVFNTSSAATLYKYPYSCGTKRPVMRQGSAGSCVRALQWAINRGGSCEILVVDGKFGPATNRVTKNYQSFKGLKRDGIVGSKTWSSLDSWMRYIDGLPKGSKGGCW